MDSTAFVDGRSVRVIDPSLFYAAATLGMGLGLFCRTDLLPGDIWWAHNLSDPRYVHHVLTWNEFEGLSFRYKRIVQRYCYVDTDSRLLVMCSNPFYFVNHGTQYSANCTSDSNKNSIAAQRIPTGTQLLIPYDYEPVISLVWKFESFKLLLSEDLLEDEDFLFSPAANVPIAKAFLNSIG